MKRNRILTMVIALSLTAAVGCGNKTGGDKAPKVDKKKVESKVQKNENIPSEFKNIVKMFDNIYDFKIPYFGGYSHKDKQIVVFSESGDKAVIWNFDGKGNSKVVDKNTIAEEKRVSSFADGILNGRKTTYVMYESDESTFALAVHEGYHFYGQKWINNIEFENSKPRGTFYPENIQLRSDTFQMYNKLREKITRKNKNGDGEALFIFNKALKNSKKDVEGDLNTEISEGTANFMEYMFTAAAKYPERKKNLTDIAKKAYELDLQAQQAGSDKFDKGYQYYKISSLPFYYAAMNGKHELLKDITGVKYPYRILKNFTEEVPSKEDLKVKEEITKYYDEFNNRAKAIVEGEMSKAGKKEYVKITIAESVFPGSMQFGEFINFVKDGATYTINTNTSGNSEKNDVILKDANTMAGDQGGYVVYVLKKNLKNSQGKLVIKGERVEINTNNFKKINDGEYTVG